MIKTKQDSDVTDHIGLFYVETRTEPLGPIWSSTVYDAKPY